MAAATRTLHDPARGPLMYALGSGIERETAELAASLEARWHHTLECLVISG